MKRCISCKFSSYPTKDNGDLIIDKDGKCGKWRKSIGIKSGCSYCEESDSLKVAEILNKHNNEVMKNIHESSKSMCWNGDAWTNSNE